jgi:hypothetical protein
MIHIERMIAQVDGDALNLMLMPDNRLAQGMSRLAPHLTTFSLQKPGEISRVADLPGPDIATWSKWINEESGQRILN